MNEDNRIKAFNKWVAYTEILLNIGVSVKVLQDGIITIKEDME